LNFTKVGWRITEILGSRVLAETPCICILITFRKGKKLCNMN
jgi:hypothetical protein